MPGNSFGQLFRITTFGESHGEAIGVVVDGCPAGMQVDVVAIQAELDRRRPGQSGLVSQRRESDAVQILSGIYEGKTLGTPIAMLLHNEDARSGDYSHLAHTFRPSHADYTWTAKYGLRDHRGGGRSSARETAARVAAGALARQFLKSEGLAVTAFVSQVGEIVLDRDYKTLDLPSADRQPVRCPDPATAAQMEALIAEACKSGDTVGGAISCVVSGCPPGLGEPVFDRLHADLGKAVLSINACKGFEIGSGFRSAGMRGSEHNDPFTADGGKVKTLKNWSGGIQGGISNGMDIWFRAAFKPVATIMQDQQSVDDGGRPVIVKGRGRHDPCVVPRAVPIVEAMTCLVLADHLLRQRCSRAKMT